MLLENGTQHEVFESRINIIEYGEKTSYKAIH